MKKRTIICLGLILSLLLMFTACNQGIGFGNYSFKHIHFSDGSEGHCATVNKWYEAERGIEVDTKEYGALWCSEGTYTLIEDGKDCPYCH